MMKASPGSRRYTIDRPGHRARRPRSRRGPDRARSAGRCGGPPAGRVDPRQRLALRNGDQVVGPIEQGDRERTPAAGSREIPARNSRSGSRGRPAARPRTAEMRFEEGARLARPRRRRRRAARRRQQAAIGRGGRAERPGRGDEAFAARRKVANAAAWSSSAHPSSSANETGLSSAADPAPESSGDGGRHRDRSGEKAARARPTRVIAPLRSRRAASWDRGCRGCGRRSRRR